MGAGELLALAAVALGLIEACGRSDLAHDTKAPFAGFVRELTSVFETS